MTAIILAWRHQVIDVSVIVYPFGDGCTSVTILKPLNCTLQMGKL